MKKILLMAWLLLGAVGGVEAQTSSAPTTLQHAIDLFERQRWADARHELMRLRRELNPDQVLEMQQVEYYLALTAVEMKNPDAEQVLLNFEQRFPGSLRTNDIHFALASYYASKEQFEESEKYFKQVDYATLEADNRTKYNIRRGYIAYRQGERDNAYGYFKKVEPTSRYSEHATYYCAYIDNLEGRTQKAREGFEKLIHSENYHTVAPFYLLQLEFKEQHYTEVTSRGEELLEQLQGTYRHDMELLLAESWYHLGNYEKCLEYLEAYRAGGDELSRESSYLEGFSCYRLGRYAASVEALRRVTGPKDALTQNAAYHLGDCYLQLGDKLSAMQAFSMAIDPSLNATLSEDALYNYGKLQYELDEGLFNEAINSLTRYMELYPNSERTNEVQSLLAAAYYNSENYEAAYAAIRELPAPDNDLRAAHQKITYFYALESLTEGNLSQAEKLLKEAQKEGVSPRYTALSGFWLGEIALHKGEFTQAENYLKGYMQRAPKQEREYNLARYNLGYCALYREQYPAAEEYFTAFLKGYTINDNFYYDALNRQGDSRYAMRNYEGALQSYGTVKRSGTLARHYAAYQEALSLGILNRPNEKVAALKQIITDNKGDYVDDATYELGRTYIARSQYHEGAKQLKHYVESYPNAPHYTAALSDLGMVYANLGEQEQALAYYTRVIEQAPHSAEARTALQGVREIYLSRGDAEGYFAYARQHGGEGDLSHQTRDSLSFSAAQRLYLENRHSDAARSLRSYLKSFPEGNYLTDGLYYLANCYHQLVQEESEYQTLKQLADQGQNNYTAEVLGRLAPLAEKQGDHTLAATTYHRLMRCAPTQAERNAALEGYALATLAQGDEEAIVKMATEVEQESGLKSTTLRRVRFAHATLLKRQGKREQALKIYKQISEVEVRSAEGGESLYRQIEHLFDRGELKACEALIFNFSERPTPNNYWLAKAYILLGDLYQKQGDNFQARATYQSVADGYSPSDDGIVSEARQRISTLKE